MQQYLDLLQDILDNGHDHSDRTGTGRRSVFGRMLRFDLNDGFPVVTTRKINTKAFIMEMLWHISGSEDISQLKENSVNIWNNWAVSEADIDSFSHKFLPPEVANLPNAREFLIDRFLNKVGNIYGKNWRNLLTTYNPLKLSKSSDDYAPDKLAELKQIYDNLDPEFKQEIENFENFVNYYSVTHLDQLGRVIDNLKARPFSSRHVITSWVPEFIPDETLSPQENVMLGHGALAPCPTLLQFFVTPGTEQHQLSLMLTQRSIDVPVGGAFNIAQYSLLLAMVAQIVDMQPKEFIWSLGDAHIYSDQIELVKEQLARQPLRLPTLRLNPHIKDIDQFRYEDIIVLNYQSHPAINYPVAV
jgi:thymidylate synthase